MPTATHVESVRRIHESETFRSCHLSFPGGRVAIDMGGNAKGLLGRTPRPGFTEIDGTCGAIVRLPGEALGGMAELRATSGSARARDGKADPLAPFVDLVEDGTWIASRVRTPGATLEVLNPHRPGPITGPKLREWDAAAVMEIVAEFAEVVAGRRTPEFSARDALMATEVEMACRESALRQGVRIDLPVAAADLESDAEASRAVRTQFGVDPLDAGAMLAIRFPPAA